jgi:hypothetical protein
MESRIPSHRSRVCSPAGSGTDCALARSRRRSGEGFSVKAVRSLRFAHGDSDPVVGRKRNGDGDRHIDLAVAAKYDFRGGRPGDYFIGREWPPSYRARPSVRRSCDRFVTHEVDPVVFAEVGMKREIVHALCRVLSTSGIPAIGSGFSPCRHARAAACRLVQ